MKAKKFVSLAIPILLLVGCGVGEKDSEPKTDEVSKEVEKRELSEEDYPYHVFKKYASFENGILKYEEAVNKVINGSEYHGPIGFALQDMNTSLEGLIDVKPPSRFELEHEELEKGVEEVRKGTEMMREAHKRIEMGETTKLDEASEGFAVVQNGYEIMKPILAKLKEADPDAFLKAKEKDGL